MAGISGGGRVGGASSSRVRASRGSAKAGGGKSTKAGRTAAGSSETKAETRAARPPNDAAKAAANEQIQSELAKDRVTADGSQQQAEQAVKGADSGQAEQRQQGVDDAVASARGGGVAEDAARSVRAVGGIASAVAGTKGLGKAFGSSGQAAFKAIETGAHVGKAYDAAINGDTGKALEEGGRAVISGMQSAAALAKSPIGKVAKFGSRFAGPAAAFAAAMDTDTFARSYNTALKEGGVGNWAQASWDGAKAGLSFASMVPGVGAVPGAIAGAMDLGQLAFQGVRGWLGN